MLDPRHPRPCSRSSRYYLSERYLEVLKAHRKRHEEAGHGFGYVIRDLDGVSGRSSAAAWDGRGNLIVDRREHSMVPTTNIKSEINRGDVRKMTPREWARLQGFPRASSWNSPIRIFTSSSATRSRCR